MSLHGLNNQLSALCDMHLTDTFDYRWQDREGFGIDYGGHHPFKSYQLWAKLIKKSSQGLQRKPPGLIRHFVFNILEWADFNGRDFL